MEGREPPRETGYISDKKPRTAQGRICFLQISQRSVADKGGVGEAYGKLKEISYSLMKYSG